MRRRIKKSPRMTWRRLFLLCDAIRRSNSFGSELAHNASSGLGTKTVYRTMLKAGWMMRKCSAHTGAGRNVHWFLLTKKGRVLVDRLMEAGVSGKHVNSIVEYDAFYVPTIGEDHPVRKMFTDPARFISSHYFRTGKILPALNAEILAEFIPAGGK